VLTTRYLKHAETQRFDRDRVYDVINLLRAVGCVLSGAALLVREVRHFVRIKRSPENRAAKTKVRLRPLRRVIRQKDNRMMTTTLYRPVGPEELALIAASGYREFPPRLAEQPIFYPVTNESYATQIARDWNVKASGAGFVTRVAVRSDYLAGYRVETVGSSVHQEYWIPAAELPSFNAAIIGVIEVIAEFRDKTDTP
jgi:hypothetical protein